MRELLNSFSLVFVGEMGDKTQLLALLLTARFRKPLVILVAIFFATILNHGLATVFGGWVSSFLSPSSLKWILALTFFFFAGWILIPDKVEENQSFGSWGPFLTTFVSFFLAEMGDKTQLATVALGATYSNLYLVTFGTTLGMMASNSIAIFFGERFLSRVPMKTVRMIASFLFFIFGVLVLFSNP